MIIVTSLTPRRAIVFSLIVTVSALFMFYWFRYGVQIETSRIDLGSFAETGFDESYHPVFGDGFGSIGQLVMNSRLILRFLLHQDLTANVIDSNMSPIFFHGLSSSFIFLGYGVVIKKPISVRGCSRMSLHIIFASIISIPYFTTRFKLSWSFLFILLIFVQ